MSDDIFDKINFSEVNIDPPVFDGDKLVIKIHNVTLVSDNGYSLKFIGSAFLIFYGVVKSTRKISEYIGDPKKDGCKESYYKDDVVYSNSDLEGKVVYEFEGFLTNPLAWIGSWIIYCDSCEFRKSFDI